MNFDFNFVVKKWINVLGTHNLVKACKNSIGICLIGGQSIDGTPDCNFTFKQYGALIELIRDLKKDYKEVTIVGHRDMADSLSPHFNVSELLR